MDTIAVMLDVPADMYEPLRQLAEHAEQTPSEWILGNLRRQLVQSRDQNLRRHFGAVNLGVATGADNEAIDADLVRAYAMTTKVA